MAAETEYQNLFPVYCNTKPLLLVLCLDTEEVLAYLDSVFMVLAQFEPLTSGLSFKDESFSFVFISGHFHFKAQ